MLITLGIIGIVAAMTLPTLIQKQNEQATVTQVKKFYSVFSQAYTQAILENGTIDNWGLEDSQTTELEDGSTVHTENSKEQAEKFLKIFEPYLKKISSSKINDPKQDFSKGFVLADGTAISNIWIKPSLCKDNTSYCGDFYIRTHGKENNESKSPYIFAFYIKKNRILPVGYSDAQLDTCTSGKNYSYCTAWVISKGNMDYLHCNNLNWKGKSKCK